MKKSTLFAVVFGSLLAVPALSQAPVDVPAALPILEKPNIFKVNLAGVPFGSYTLQYERVINRKQSLGMTITYSPDQDLPFKTALLNIFGNDAQATSAINSTLLNTISITPEYRFYAEVPGAPFGFYAATFLRYVNMTHSGTYSFQLSDGEHKPYIETTFNGFGVGEMIGIQWKLGNSMTLDWWILGPFVGVLNGSSHGDDNRVVNDADKADLEADIEDVGNSIPGWTVEATVSDHPTTGLGVVDADLSGLLIGARVFGICLGYRF